MRRSRWGKFKQWSVWYLQQRRKKKSNGSDSNVWILEKGKWNDLGVWKDSAKWVD